MIPYTFCLSRPSTILVLAQNFAILSIFLYKATKKKTHTRVVSVRIVPHVGRQKQLCKVQMFLLFV